MLTIPLLLVGALFFWLGWKARGIFEKRPRWLFKGQKGTGPGDGTKPGANGVVDRLGRAGEGLVGKGVEFFMGKPKKPKDDKEGK